MVRLCLCFIVLAKALHSEVAAFFEPNVGQAHNSVQFVSRGVSLSNGCAVLTLGDKTVRLKLVNASSGRSAQGVRRLPGITNYYIGDDSSKWWTDVPHFEAVRYYDVYPGIDVVYYGKGRDLEYDFVVSPGANPETITLAYEGAEKVHIDSNGDVIIAANGLQLRQHRPRIYQDIAGVRVEVFGKYMLRGNDHVQFALAQYDSSEPLTIDPVLEYSTYFGGNGYSFAAGVAVDANGSAHVTGYVRSPNYPALDPFLQVSGTTENIFIAKLSPNGNSLIYYTYVGGSQGASSKAITLDQSGNAYVTGWTSSTDFPTKNPAQKEFGGGFNDAVLLKLSPTGKLIYSTYLGGDSDDVPNAIAVDKQGAAFVAGYTHSTRFPVKNALQSQPSGRPDAFVAKLSPGGEQFLFATYLGGIGADYAYGLALDSGGNPLVAGVTFSADFPIERALQGVLGGSGAQARNGFLTKISGTGDKLLFSTYFGGSANSILSHVAVDTLGNYHVLGGVFDDRLSVKGALQGIYGGGLSDFMIGKIASGGDEIMYATYLGGTGEESASGFALDSADNIYLLGLTSSSDFPAKNSLQPFIPKTAGAKSDVVVAKISPNGGSLIYSTFISGHGDDRATGLAIDPQGGVYAVGFTSSDDFPVKNAIQSTFGGGFADMYLFKLSADATPVTPLFVTPSNLPFRYGVGGSLPETQSVSVTSSGPAVAFTILSTASWLSVSSNSSITPATLAVSVNPSGLAVGSYSGAIMVGTVGTIQVSLAVFAPIPVISTVSPSTLIVGSEDTVATVSGSGFLQGAQVRISGTPAQETTYVDSTTLRVLLPKSLLTTAGTLSLTVANPGSSPSTAFSLTVGAAPPQIATEGVVNAASFVSGPVAPGEIVTLFGTQIGPPNLTQTTFDENGRVVTKLADTRVLFDGVAAPLVYVSSKQLTAIVPYSVAGKTNVGVEVEYLGRKSASVQMPILASAPGLFTMDSSGRGQSASLNQDSSYNSPSSPADRRSIVVVYATGEGQTDPPSVDGQVAGGTPPKPSQTVSVTIGGINAEVLYAGGAPGQVAGLLQINVRVPQDVPPGSAELIVAIGARSSPKGVTLSLH